jgi:DNA polymerase III epsilon subunit-like protein
MADAILRSSGPPDSGCAEVVRTSEALARRGVRRPRLRGDRPRLHPGSNHLLRSRAIDGGRVETDGAVYDLVDPGPVMVSAASAAVHGLRPEDLRGASSAEAAREALRAALSRRYLITWHGHVEASFLGVLFGTTPRRWLRRSVDVRWLALALLGAEGACLTLSEAADRFEVPVAAPHHALDDALVTANLFLVTAAQLGSEGLRTARDALRMGRARGPSSRRPVVPR